MVKSEGAEGRTQSQERRGHRSRLVVEDYLNDILTAISKIDRYTAGVSEQQFCSDSTEG